MRVVAVINRKGGSGKSTLATHLAGHCARAGVRVMLGDVDLQHSSLAWIARRAGRPGLAPISGWAVDRLAVVRPPAGITHVVLDTPGGLRGADLARAVFAADAVLIPVCASRFDRESALECHAELMALPRVASGRCKVAVVGMRLHARTRYADDMAAWAAAHGLPYLGGIAGSETYVRTADEGLTLFDLPPEDVQRELAQWAPITGWLDEVWAEADRAQQAARTPLRPLDRKPAVLQPQAVLPSRQQARATAATGAVSRPARPARRLEWLYDMFRSSAAPVRQQVDQV
jgi:chromosome partitioning protein